MTGHEPKDDICQTEPAQSSIALTCLRIFLISLLSFWLFAIAGTYFRAHAAHHPFNFKAFFLNEAKDPYQDFTLIDSDSGKKFDPHGFLTMVYPAPLMCVFLLFWRVIPNPIFMFELLIVSSALLACLSAMVYLHRKSRLPLLAGVTLVASFLFCYPLWFEMERANMEIVVFIVQALAVAALLTRRTYTAAILIALAASMKLYPALLLLLFLPWKRYKEFACALAAGGVFMLTGLAIVGPTILEAHRAITTSMALIAREKFFNFAFSDLGYDHSLFSLVKQGIRFGYHGDYLAIEKSIHSRINAAATPYSIAVFIAFFAFYLLVIRKLPLLNQFFALVFCSTLIPHVAFEYTTIQILIPWTVFVCFLLLDMQQGETGLPGWAAALIVLCFAFLFSPDYYLGGASISLGGQLKALTMLLLVCLFCLFPLRNSLFADPPTPA